MRLQRPNAALTSALTLAGLILFAVCVVATAPASAQTLSNVVQIEEHWELQIAQPDMDRSAPQTTMVMSPTADLGEIHFLFTLNHVSAPGFEAGGLQAELWDGDNMVDETVASEIGALGHADEVIRWVQRLSLVDGTLTFEVLNGESETWGQFGSEDLSFSVPTSLIRLNAYKPAVSIGESQVSYAENRVVSLVLTKLRWVKDNGQVHEQNAPIPVDTSLDE